MVLLFLRSAVILHWRVSCSAKSSSNTTLSDDAYRSFQQFFVRHVRVLLCSILVCYYSAIIGSKNNMKPSPPATNNNDNGMCCTRTLKNKIKYSTLSPRPFAQQSLRRKIRQGFLRATFFASPARVYTVLTSHQPSAVLPPTTRSTHNHVRRRPQAGCQGCPEHGSRGICWHHFLRHTEMRLRRCGQAGGEEGGRECHAPTI